MNLNFQINRTEDLVYGYSYFSAFANIDNISPVPVTTNLIVSPTGQIRCEVWAGHSVRDYSGSAGYNLLSDLIYACTNGQWTLYINKGHASEQQFKFNISMSGLTTNVLTVVNVITPTNNQTDLPTNTIFQWSVPAIFTSASVSAFKLSGPFIGSAFLSGSPTNWPAPAAMPYGTTSFNINCSANNYPNVTITMPVDSNSNPVQTWNPQAQLNTSKSLKFVVGAPAPLPVQITGSNLQAGGGNLSFAFQTLAGRPHTIQSRTNLTSGTWINVTNFVGDGSTRQFAFPTTNSFGEYFRVMTQ